MHLLGGDSKSVRGPESEVYRFGNPILRGQLLRTFPRIGTRLEPPHPVDVAPDIPSTRRAVELVRPWSEARIGHSLPVGKVVARPPTGLSEVRHLVVLE